MWYSWVGIPTHGTVYFCEGLWIIQNNNFVRPNKHTIQLHNVKLLYAHHIFNFYNIYLLYLISKSRY